MFRRISPVATCATVAQSRAIYEYKFGQVPLTKPFVPGGGHGKGPKPAPAPVEAPVAGKVEVTKLHNGARVITQNFGGPSVSVGAYVLAGPAYDPDNCPGVGSMMHLALTTSNYNNALFQLDRNIRSVGAAESHFEVDKHYIGIRIDCRADKWKAQVTSAGRRNALQKENAPQVEGVNLVQDNIFTCLAAPRFHETDIERFRDTIDNQLKELRWQAPAAYAVQQLETVAFYREPLGNPRFVPELNNGNISSKVLLDQYSRYIVPSRIVIAGVNVEHAALIAEYENTPYPHSASAPHHARADAPKRAVDVKDEAKQYTGGERQDHEDRAKEMGTKPDMDTETICAVGWLAYGKEKKSLKDYAASLVLKQVFDVAFKDGIRYNRDEAHVHEGVRAFYNPYITAGLIGFTAVAEPKHAVAMVTDTAALVKSKKTPSEAELALAKGRATVQFLSNTTDSIRDYCDFLGTSLPLDDASVTPLSVDEVVDAIKSVSAADVGRVTERMFSKPTSFYGHGEMLGFPSLRQLGL